MTRATRLINNALLWITATHNQHTDLHPQRKHYLILVSASAHTRAYAATLTMPTTHSASYPAKLRNPNAPHTWALSLASRLSIRATISDAMVSYVAICSMASPAFLARDTSAAIAVLTLTVSSLTSYGAWTDGKQGYSHLPSAIIRSHDVNIHATKHANRENSRHVGLASKTPVLHVLTSTGFLWVQADLLMSASSLTRATRDLAAVMSASCPENIPGIVFLAVHTRDRKANNVRNRGIYSRSYTADLQGKQAARYIVDARQLHIAIVGGALDSNHAPSK